MKTALFTRQVARQGLALVLTAAASTALAQAPQWQKISLADSITVEFPGAPRQKEMQSKLGLVRAYVLGDSNALYMTMTQAQAMDEAATDAEIAEFYGGTLKGLGGQILARDTFSVNGFPGIEAQFTTPDRPRLPAVKFMRVVVVNGTAYTQQFWTSTAHRARLAADRQRFFASFRPNVAQVPQVADGVRTDSQAYRIGKLLGGLTFYGALAIGGFLVLRRLVRWSDKPSLKK